MGNKIGAKGGRKDLKLTIQNKRRKNKKEIQEIKRKKRKIEQDAKQKEQQLITNFESKQEKCKEDVVQQSNLNDNTHFTNDLIEIEITNLEKEKEETLKEKQTNQKVEEIIIQTPLNLKDDQENIIPIFKKPKEYKKRKGNKEKNNNLNSPDTDNIKNQMDIPSEKKEETTTFLEQQIIKVLEQEIDEKKYSLKKMDSEIYAIQQNIDSITEEQELLVLEQEIKKLIDKIEEIKRQIISLERALDFKFPIENPDNYLIYLVEEYKNNRKDEIDLEKKFQESEQYQTLIDTIIIVEAKQETIQKQLEEKKSQMELEEEQIQKLQNDMINIEEWNQKIEKMLEQSQNVLEEMTIKVKEAVHITEKVNYVTKQVNHSLLELFLLMNIFKRNLSIKNSAVAAITAAIALDMILKITTPIQEKKMVKEIKMTDYKNMIERCLDDTNFLENTIHENLNQISSLRYTFEHNYQSCSYLPSYQEALDKLSNLEENMKEHRENIIRMKQEMENQLEKNNAKVKKYDSIKAA